MAKSDIIIISRKQVDTDIQREKNKGKSAIEATVCVMGNAATGIKEASKTIDALVRKAKGFENLTEEQKAKYDSICRSIIEPEYQRIGHCKNIIAELSKSK